MLWSSAPKRPTPPPPPLDLSRRPLTREALKREEFAALAFKELLRWGPNLNPHAAENTAIVAVAYADALIAALKS